MFDAVTRVSVLPVWTGPVDPKPMTGVINRSYYVEDAGQGYVVRFGRDYPQHHVIRSREVMVANAAYAAGFSTEIVYSGPGVTVGRYIQGRTLTAETVQANIERIVPRLRAFHAEMPRHVSGGAFMFWPFHTIRDYARLLKADRLDRNGEADRWLALANEMEAVQVPLPFVLSHNDLVFTNILDDGQIWFIDFEYAGFSIPLFDLTGLAGHAGFDDEQHVRLLTAYFGKEPDASLQRAYDGLLCIALLREVLWATVSDIHVDISDMDFPAYAERYRQRFEAALDRYRARYGPAP